jgi:hypothetical protein
MRHELSFILQASNIATAGMPQTLKDGCKSCIQCATKSTGPHTPGKDLVCNPWAHSAWLWSMSIDKYAYILVGPNSHCQSRPPWHPCPATEQPPPCNPSKQPYGVVSAHAVGSRVCDMSVHLVVQHETQWVGGYAPPDAPSQEAHTSPMPSGVASLSCSHSGMTLAEHAEAIAHGRAWTHQQHCPCGSFACSGMRPGPYTMRQKWGRSAFGVLAVSAIAW